MSLARGTGCAHLRVFCVETSSQAVAEGAHDGR